MRKLQTPFRDYGERVDLRGPFPELFPAEIKKQKENGYWYFLAEGDDSCVFKIANMVLKLYGRSVVRGEFSRETLLDYRKQQLIAKEILEKETPWDCRVFHNCLVPGKKDPYQVIYSVIPLKQAFSGIGPNLERLLLGLAELEESEISPYLPYLRHYIKQDTPVATQTFIPGKNWRDATTDRGSGRINYHLFHIFLKGVWEVLALRGACKFDFTPVNVKVEVQDKNMKVIITDLAHKLN